VCRSLTKHVEEGGLRVAAVLVVGGAHVAAALVPLHGEVEDESVPPYDVTLPLPRPVVRGFWECLGAAEDPWGDVVLSHVHDLVRHGHVLRWVWNVEDPNW
jgi:hypothetical protein